MIDKMTRKQRSQLSSFYLVHMYDDFQKYNYTQLHININVFDCFSCEFLHKQHRNVLTRTIQIRDQDSERR